MELLISEILDKVSEIKTKKEKVSFLKHYDSDALRMVIKSSFDPQIKWALPDGEVPYEKNEAPEGTEHTLLSQEARRLYHFIQGADNVTPRAQKENMYIQMLEGLHEDEAEILVYAKDKKLHQKIKGLSHEVVKTAFGWNSDYVRLDSVSK